MKKPRSQKAVIRQQRLNLILEQRFDGSPADLAKAIERDDAYVWQILTGRRNIGEKSADNIEEKLELGPGGLHAPFHGASDFPAQADPLPYGNLNYDREAVAKLTEQEIKRLEAMIAAFLAPPDQSSLTYDIRNAERHVDGTSEEKPHKRRKLKG